MDCKAGNASVRKSRIKMQRKLGPAGNETQVCIWAIRVSAAVLISRMLAKTVYAEVGSFESKSTNSEKGTPIVGKETAAGYSRTQAIGVGDKVRARKGTGSIDPSRVGPRDERTLMPIDMYSGGIEVDCMSG